MNSKSNIHPKCRYCDTLLVKDKETHKIPQGRTDMKGININEGKVVETYTCPECGYSELFAVT